MSQLENNTTEICDDNNDSIYQRLEMLGEGDYGNGWKVLNKNDGNIYALKCIPIEKDDFQIVEKEFNILKSCESPYMVKYYGASKKDQEIQLAFEYCGGGSVQDLVSVMGPVLNEQHISAICSSVLKGLVYLHSQHLIYNEMKAGNILLTDEGDVKLSDFCVSEHLRSYSARRGPLIGTPHWMAPELISQTETEDVTAADIWSLGITAIEMAEGKPPLSDVHPMRAIFMISRSPPPTLSNPENWSEEFRDFISCCLDKDPAGRPSAKNLLSHKFIQQANKSNEIFKELIEKKENFESEKLED